MILEENRDGEAFVYVVTFMHPDPELGPTSVAFLNWDDGEEYMEDLARRGIDASLAETVLHTSPIRWERASA